MGTTKDQNQGWQDRFEVRETPDRGKGLFFKGPFKRGETLFHFTGSVVSRQEAFCHDAQIGPHEFIRLDEPWRYINHSCDPVCGMGGELQIVAMRNGADEELTIDYAMIDWEDWGNDAPIICSCGSEARCRKVYLGYMGLTSFEKKEYEGHIAPWLLRREKRYSAEAFLRMRLKGISEFAARGSTFLETPEELKRFIDGVAHNLGRIASIDV